MKRRHNIIVCLLFAAMCMLGCGEDRTYEYLELTQENQWIFQKMQDVYLWSDSMKKPGRQSFFAKSSAFFETLLQKGDEFSHFADSAINTSYGIGYAVLRDPLEIQKSKVYALVLFVEPGSPAAAAGLKRGDWITKIGKYNISLSNYGYLDRGETTTVQTSKIVLDEQSMEYVWQDGDTLHMDVATTLSPRDVYIDTVYVQRGRKIGYLAYNRFSQEGKDETVAAMERFKQQGVTELIIDLRYNCGGSISVAAQLASMIVPSTNVGDAFCSLKYNAFNSEQDTVYKYVQSNTLSLDKLYIISGGATRGAAETFIGALQQTIGYNNAIVVGEKTVGQNFATQTYESPYNFSITPVTAFVENVDGESMYPGGIIPNYSINELADFYKIYNLGNTQEYVLYNVIYYIVNGTFPSNDMLQRAGVVSRCIPKYGKSISR